MILFPNAKINIGLNILNKRSDGFHEIESIMYPVSLSDILDISKGTPGPNGKVNLTESGITTGSSYNDNLIIKAYNILDKDFDLDPISAHLHKSIPTGAGLGGGSANAAYMLSGLNSIFELNLDDNRLEHYAARLGSDCAFFIQNKPAIATGRGELLKTIQVDLKDYYIAIVIPNTPISTKEAYSKVTPKAPDHILQESIGLPIESWKTFIKNDFEDSVFSQKPEIEAIKNELIFSGATYSALSGSGSAVFGIFREKPELIKFREQNYFTWISEA